MWYYIKKIAIDHIESDEAYKFWPILVLWNLHEKTTKISTID